VKHTETWKGSPATPNARGLTTNGQLSGTNESWLASPAGRPISLSPPLRPSREPYRAHVESYFDNLLPDNRQIRERIQRRFQTDSPQPFDLLREIGRDCVGALQLLEEDEPAPDIRTITGEPLTSEGVEQLLAAALTPSFGQFDDPDPFRISLAGAQEKRRYSGIAINGTGRRVRRQPHIFSSCQSKRARKGSTLRRQSKTNGSAPRSCRPYGIAVAPCRMSTFGRFKTLVVERFDRRLAEGHTHWLRLPQEDFCQATGTPPALKYENDGGPGIRQVMDIRSLPTARPRTDAISCAPKSSFGCWPRLMATPSPGS
jgi:serine/threonine-protein kinase HipA